MTRKMTIVLGFLALSSCGAGGAAGETPVRLQDGEWTITPFGLIAENFDRSRRSACIGVDNRETVLPWIMDGGLADHNRRVGNECHWSDPRRTGNLVLANLTCDDPKYGTLNMTANAVLTATSIDVDYRLDTSRLTMSPDELEDFDKEVIKSPPRLTARRIGDC